MDGILNPYINMIKNWNQLRGTMDRRTYWSALLTALVILAVLIWFAEKIPGLNILVKGFLLLMAAASVVAEHGFSEHGLHRFWHMGFFFFCSTACKLFPDWGSNLGPLPWQADSEPLDCQGSPALKNLEPPKRWQRIHTQKSHENTDFIHSSDHSFDTCPDLLRS